MACQRCSCRLFHSQLTSGPYSLHAAQVKPADDPLAANGMLLCDSQMLLPQSTYCIASAAACSPCSTARCSSGCTALPALHSIIVLVILQDSEMQFSVAVDTQGAASALMRRLGVREVPWAFLIDQQVGTQSLAWNASQSAVWSCALGAVTTWLPSTQLGHFLLAVVVHCRASSARTTTRCGWRCGQKWKA